MANTKINITPSFEASISWCIIVLESGTEEGKGLARQELMRYGRELDRLAAQSGSSFDAADTPIEGE